MEKSIDQFFIRTRSESYDCLDFSCEVWKYLCPSDSRLELLRDARSGDVKLYPSIVKQFEKISRPCSPCIVLMRRLDGKTHIGIYYADRILHLPTDCVRSELPAVVKCYLTDVEYYR